MQHTGSILALALTAIAAAYLAYRIRKERQRLRECVHLLDQDQLRLIESVEQLVWQKELVPMKPRVT